MPQGTLKPLFDALADPFDGPKPRGMRLYEYYSRSAKPEIVSLRSRWNAIFRQCRLGVSKKQDLRGRFRKKKDGQHLSAVFELFMYELIHSMGCKLRSEPKLGKYRPDYKVMRSGRGNFHLEATCAVCQPVRTDEDGWREQIYDAVRKIESDHFRLFLSFAGRMRGRPNCKKIKHLVRIWIESLNHCEVLRRQDGRRLDSRTEVRVIEEQGLRIEMSAMAVVSPTTSAPYGLVWIGPAGLLRVVDNHEHLQRSLEGKVKQVSRAILPAVVAVNLLDHPPDDDTILAAFGVPDGIWREERQPTSRHISAVMLFSSVSLDMVPSCQPLMILNPWLHNARQLIGLPYLTYCQLDSGGRSLTYLSAKPSQANGYWPEGWPGRLSLPELG